MFNNTIDKKLKITDPNGNELVDLTTSIFKKTATAIDAYNTVRITEHFLMRADKVALNEYKTDEGAEFILKYSGISNPFSLSNDEILLIPDFNEAQEQMVELTEDKETAAADQVKLYYKFTNTDFKSSSASYDKLANTKIPSGVLDPTDNSGFTIPYITDDGTTAVTIKNGRMYFGDSAIINNQSVETPQELLTLLDEKCAVNGMSLTDFVRASTKNSVANKAAATAEMSTTYKSAMEAMGLE